MTEQPDPLTSSIVTVLLDEGLPLGFFDELDYALEHGLDEIPIDVRVAEILFRALPSDVFAAALKQFPGHYDTLQKLKEPDQQG